MSVSIVTPANLINTERTLAPNAASSTATPYDSGNITTWVLPGYPTQKLVNGTQSFSTTPGEVFTDFASENILAAANVHRSLQAGSPVID